MVYITTQILMMTTLLSYIMTSIITFNNYTFIMEWVLMEFSNTKIILPIMLDPTSTIFMSTVLTIASSVMQFTKTYMTADKNKDRFVILVLLFIVSMMFLILFPHTMILLLGWDGLGITSFVLVIYYNNPKSLGAGMITALTNRIGDVMLLISITLLFNQGQWTIMNVWTQEVISWVPILILVAAMTKSAQMPFSSWLPAAMAAPTPVSALVHSSTLVTAGVFLLIRFYPMMNFEIMKTTLAMIATMTMLMASASAMAECDMKKIIALSTLSQVALMMYTLGIGMPEIAFFHLITHALFKALLFICAGNLIDIHHHSQDLRAMGNISYQLPVISSSITIANMALCGFPFLAGFYSKDLIIETSSMIMTNTNMIIMLMFIVSTVLTTAYTTRFMMFTLFMPTYSPTAQYSSEDYTQITSVLILTLMAIMGGAVTNWLMMSPSVEPNFFSSMKILAPLMVMLGLMTGIMATNNKNPMPQFIINMKCFMWFLTPMSTHLSPNMLMKLPLLELKEVDQGWSIIPYMLLNNMKTHSSMLMYSQNNSIITHMTCTTTVIMWILLSS